MVDPNDTSIAFKLGEISGQLRELIHSSANVSAKIDGLAIRVSALEAEQNRRAGATNLLNTLLKSPAVGWIVAAIIAVGGFIGLQRASAAVFTAPTLPPGGIP